MSGESSSEAGWFTRLEPAQPPDVPRRPDDPRLGEVVEFWNGDLAALRPGRAVLVGFPIDEGVRRNGGRQGAAEAPREIRRFLYRLTPWDGMRDIDLADCPPLDLGDVQREATLERSQEVLGKIIGQLLLRQTVPIVLGGGHETAYGHFLGYVEAERRVGIINFDAHLDLRPEIQGLGHSGSPFRQALEHPTHPLIGRGYVCLGVQPHAVSREHVVYAHVHGCRIHWGPKVWLDLDRVFRRELRRLQNRDCHVYVTIDADAVRMMDVPGVSAPNVVGLIGEDVLECARLAGESPVVSSLDLVEINPRFDCDSQSARWGALLIWHFLIGLARRRAAVYRDTPKN
jgi:formiminoglutamase